MGFHGRCGGLLQALRGVPKGLLQGFCRGLVRLLQRVLQGFSRRPVGGPLGGGYSCRSPVGENHRKPAKNHQKTRKIAKKCDFAFFVIYLAAAIVSHTRNLFVFVAEPGRVRATAGVASRADNGGPAGFFGRPAFLAGRPKN